MRRFNFHVNVTDEAGRLVAELGGDNTVPDDSESKDSICQSIINDLPAHLRRPGYRYSVHLTQL
ncbi:hypothetical protein ACFVXG_20450 [Kitasatospora sp. NPDC058162]|uniref:hypothetical protein n=1 Tax=Kitasatospora sp. NPDC058162 TaxID=3346362 RepID=UPI0036DA100B